MDVGATFFWGEGMEYKEKKDKLREENRVVTTPIPRIGTSATKTGRKKRYSPVKMRNNINKYFGWCEENDEVPSIKGMMIHMDMYKDQFYKYLEYPEYRDMLEHARMIISNWAENDVYQTKGLCAGKIAYMKNIHSWSDKLETNNYTEQKVITVDEARSRIEALAPKLLEVLKGHMVVDQIAHKEEKSA